MSVKRTKNLIPYPEYRNNIVSVGLDLASADVCTLKDEASELGLLQCSEQEKSPISKTQLQSQ